MFSTDSEYVCEFCEGYPIVVSIVETRKPGPSAQYFLMFSGVHFESSFFRSQEG